MGTVVSGFLALLALVLAIQTDNESLKFAATFISATGVGFAVTSYALERDKARDQRQANAEAYLQFLRQIEQQHLVEPPKRPAVCQGCRHYHGRTYGGNLLICAMHPYGAEGTSCSDWESLGETSDRTKRM